MFCVHTEMCFSVCARVGNAAIILRSRLRVRVHKDNKEKKARVDEKGLIMTNGDSEGNRKAMSYQVSIATLHHPLLLCFHSHWPANL